MIQAFAHSHAGASGFALASPASAPHPQPSRIVALSSAIALNLLLFGIVMMPISVPPPSLTSMLPPTLQLRVIPKPEEIKVVPIEHRQTQPPSRSHSRDVAVRPRDPTPLVSSSDAVIPTTSVELPALASTATSDLGTATDIGPATEPAPVQLAYRSAPPPAYPRNAMRMGLGGTVLLRILVDADGHPLRVTIERSSGHRDLDEAARTQVLSRWLFQPAIRNGLAVQAIGLVPVTFEPHR